MAIESYEQIMARLNGQQTQTPKAATDFSTYVQNLLLNPNPQGGMMSDAEAYRADPFRRQNAINASLDEALKKKQAEEAAKAAASRGGMGMMGSGGDGDGVGGRNYYQDIEDRFYQENLTMGLTPETAKTLAEQQAFEIQSANNARISSALTLFGNAVMPGATALGLSQYGPEGYMDYLQGNARVMMGDTSGYVNPTYQPKAAGVAAPVVTGSEGTTYSPEAIQYSAPGYTSSGSDGSSVSYTSDSPTTGTGADVTYGDTSWGTLF